MIRITKHRINFKRFHKWILAALLAVLVFFYFSLPSPLFDDPTSTVVYDRDGRLMGARIADDGQWRFPASDSVPRKFEECITHFEDRYFYSHPGVNLIAIGRAIRQNIAAGRIVSGGSTITMQTIRLARKGRDRTVWEKLVEMWLALRIECSFSKPEILTMYASHAPFGGNVVGLDAAAWRYFGRSAHNLSWAEAAALAVLPNAPALIHPGRNREALLKKRNLLLEKLLNRGIIDSTTCSLAMTEPLPDKPLPLPETAPHLLARLDRENHGEISKSTLSSNLQHRCTEILNRHVELLSGNGIHNAALMVVNNQTNEVLAYVGNTTLDLPGDNGRQVDIITSPRSSGSILKPFLFATMLDEGELLPTTLVADIPTTISNYSPKNFNVTYDGAVPAREALIRSLNVPAVRLLRSFGQQRFYRLLKDCGFSTLYYNADHYGLSLILGGAEVNLWDLCKVYRGMAVSLLQYPDEEITQVNGTFPEPSILEQAPEQPEAGESVFSAGAIFTTFEAMKEVRRPVSESGWDSFLSSYPIAWKTGTSFGFRDAWAVGVTPGYTVGVWAGNADGEGRPGLTGVTAAAPILFEVFDILPATGWFETPWDEMVEIPVCAESGMRPGMFCNSVDTIMVPRQGLRTEACPYHQLIHLDETEEYRVHADCYPVDKIRNKSWFVLPPAMAWFYRARDPFYQNPPPWKTGCNPAAESPMQLIWPDKPSKIYIPKEIDGSLGKVIFEAAHQNPETTIYWYVDDSYQGETIHEHKMALQPKTGKHTLALVDAEGNLLETKFEVVGRGK